MAAEVKPAKVPRWNDGLANQTEPTEGKKDLGWVLDEEPASSFFNFLQHFSGLWFKYFNQRFFDGVAARDLIVQGVDADAGVDQDGGDLTLSGGDATGNQDSELIFATAEAGTTGATNRVATERGRMLGDGTLDLEDGLEVTATAKTALLADAFLQKAIEATGGTASDGAIEGTNTSTGPGIKGVGSVGVQGTGDPGGGAGVSGAGVGSGTGVGGNGGATNGSGVTGQCTGSGTCFGVLGTSVGAAATGAGVKGETRSAAPAVRGVVSLTGTQTGDGGSFDATSSTGYGIQVLGDPVSPTRAALRVRTQDSDPTIGLVGDMYVTTAGVLRICTVAGDSAPTAPTFVNVGVQ